MELCIKLSERVLDLENTKTSQAAEITKLKERVKKLERRNKSRTSELKRLRKVGRSAQVVSFEDEGLGAQEDASKQRRKIADLDADAEVTLVDEAQGRNDDYLMFDTRVFDEQEVEIEKAVSTAKVTIVSATTTTVDELTLAQTLIEIKAAKPKAVTTAATTTTTAVTRPKARGVKLAKQREEDANIAEWDNVQAMIDADYELAARLQVQEQEELTVEEKSKLFVELIDKRKKHFARLRAEEQRRKPPTKAQKRNQMCTYLKNMDGFTHIQLKNKSFDEVQKAFDKTMVPDDEVAIDAIPLATKPPIIVDWKIIKEGKMGYFQIIRADGSSKSLNPFVEIPSGEIKVHIEVLSVLWGNGLPIPDGSLPLSRAYWTLPAHENELELVDELLEHFSPCLSKGQGSGSRLDTAYPKVGYDVLGIQEYGTTLDIIQNIILKFIS
ncbi:hypothetical protein Tco_0948373 [Tanacetum coccineum]